MRYDLPKKPTQQQRSKMKIAFKQSGGFAPIPLSCTIDTTTHPEGARIEQMVADSGFWQLNEGEKASGAFDVHVYHLQIEGKDGWKKVKLDQVRMPDSMRPLVQYLQENAKSLLPD